MPTISQDIINIEKILKEEYLPFFNQSLNVEPSPFMEEIKKETLNAADGKFGTRIGIGGGFGMSAERDNTPAYNAPIYNGFEYTSKDAYVDIKVSNKTIQLGQSNAAAMVNAVTDNIEASYEAAKWNVGRMLFGNGSGKLATVASSASTGATTVTVDDVSHLIEGLTVDIGLVSSGALTNVQTFQIISINDATKVVTLSGALTANLTTSYILVAQNSYAREITGLGAIFDSNVTSIYGLTKATNPFIVPKTIDANHDISDIIITDAVTWALDRKNTKINMMLCGDTAFREYEKYMRELDNNVTVVEKRKFIGGAVGYEVMCGNQTTTIVREKFVPATEMWGVDTSLFTLKETGWNFCEYQGSVFTLQPGTSVYRALLANYMELICKNPGSLVKITNVSPE